MQVVRYVRFRVLCAASPSYVPARRAMSDSQPASKKPCLGGRIDVCSTCAGADAVLCDLEDICPYVGVRVVSGSCLGRCGTGPNCFVEAIPSPSDDTGAGTGHSSRKAAYEDMLEDIFKTSAETSDEPWSNASVGFNGWGDHGDVVTRIISFEDCLDVVRSALKGSDFEVPEAVLHRARLRSDAMRRMDSGFEEDLKEAENLLSKAIDLELQVDVADQDATVAKPALPAQHSFGDRLQQLRMLRGDVRGTKALAQYDGALADFNAVLEDKPTYAQAHLEKAKLLRRARRLPEALESYQAALQVIDDDAHSRRWIDRKIHELEERLVEQAAVDRGELGRADAADAAAVDSGDGSGRWRVVKITGLSLDSCIYHLQNHPPAEPHPCPDAAWHVCVRFGAHIREYTPVSTVGDWEQGKLDLLVKTYPNGSVSSRFATLQKQNDYAPFEEQQCWVLVSAPRVTLHLPSLSEASADELKSVPAVRHADSQFDGRWTSHGLMSAIKGQKIHAADGRLFTLKDLGKGNCIMTSGEETLMQGCITEEGHLKWSYAGKSDLWERERRTEVVTPANGVSSARVAHVGLVVGGTGIAPALQLLREAADPAGAFGPDCKATLLYSSRTSRDVLMLDELREVARQAPERIAVWHTLTEEFKDKQAIEAAQRALSDRMSRIPGRHYHFASRFRPFKPATGPLCSAEGEEAGLRGRVTANMLASLLPPPGPGVRVVLCGPPEMLQDVQAMLCWLGHTDDAVVELKAFSGQQTAKSE